MLMKLRISFITNYFYFICPPFALMTDCTQAQMDSKPVDHVIQA